MILLLAESRALQYRISALILRRIVVESRHCRDRFGMSKQAACPGVIGLQSQAPAQCKFCRIVVAQFFLELTH